MNYRGLLRGNTIELAERPPFPDGQPLRVSVEAWPALPPAGSAQAIRQAMHAPPHLSRGAVDELETGPCEPPPARTADAPPTGPSVPAYAFVGDDVRSLWLSKPQFELTPRSKMPSQAGYRTAEWRQKNVG
jgi:hypothetical protein